LLVEPRRPAVIREQPQAHWFAVAAVCIGALMGQLDASIVTVALPTLQRTFHASVGAVTWVGLSYLLVLVATVTAVGRFADMWGRKLLYVYGFVLFVVASAACAVAPDLVTLCIFRAFQAIGAAMLQANSLAIIVLCVPSRSLGRAIGLQGAAQALGLALGPTIGGFLLAAGGWRWIFFVNVPFGVVGTVAALLLIPRSQDLAARVRFDWRGLAVFVPAIAALLSALSFGATEGWTSALTIGLFAAAVVLVLIFIAVERRDADPMLDLRLIARPRFAAGIGSGIGAYLVMFGVLLLVPFYLERALGLGAGRAGLELMAMPVAFGLVAPFAGRLADRTGARVLTVSGMAVVVGALVIAAAERPGTAAFVALLAAIGIGLGLFTSPNNAAIMGAAPGSQAGMASGVLNMSRGLGTSLGLALTGVIFTVSGGGPRHAFSVTAFVLAGVAAAAGLVAALRPEGALADIRLSAIE
jgi:EmrB/QacA subfamily drug resistance transporter